MMNNNEIINKTFLSIGKNKLEREKFKKIKNLQYSNKPDGGLWASSYIENGEYKSDWIKFCINQDFNYTDLQKGVLFTIKQESRICIIDNMDDLENLLKYYKSEQILDTIDYSIQYLDYEKIAIDYDVIYLSHNGQWETRFARYLLGEGKGIDLYGWYIETLLVLNFDCIDKQQPIDLK